MTWAPASSCAGAGVSVFFPEGRLRVYVYGAPVDMRKSFTGLYALIKHTLGHDPLSGDLYGYINRSGNYLTVGYF